MTPRSLILIKAFWFYGRFAEAMSFQDLTFYLKSHNLRTENFSIVWLPRVKCLLLLCKAKPAWIKRSIHYVTLQHYNPGELLKEIPPYFERDFWYKRSKFWKWHCLRKMNWNQNAFIRIINLKCHFAGKRMFYSLMHSLTWFSPWFPWN